MSDILGTLPLLCTKGVHTPTHSSEPDKATHSSRENPAHGVLLGASTPLLEVQHAPLAVRGAGQSYAARAGRATWAVPWT